MDRWIKVWEEFLALCNGGFGDDGKWRHHRSSPASCQGFSEEVLAEKLANVIRKLHFCRKPGEPILAKWTKVGPALDWYLLAVLTNDLLSQAVKVAFADISTKEAEASGIIDEDAKFSEAGSWPVVRGVRLIRFRRITDDRPPLIILCICLEPIRYLTEHFIQCASEMRNKMTPGVFKFVNPRRSPVNVALNYIQDVLQGIDGASSRLVLMYRGRGFQSFEDWSRACPEEALMLRHGLMVVYSWIHERHACRFERAPLSLLMLGDPTRSRQDREQCVQCFKDTASRCCVPWGIRPWFDQSEDDLLGVEFACLCFRVAGMMLLGIADVECRHHRTHVNTGQGQAFWHTCADYVNKEAKALCTICTKRRLAHQGAEHSEPAAADDTSIVSDDAPDDALPDALKFMTQIHRGMSAFEIFKRVVNSELRARGRGLSAGDPALNNLVWGRWVRLGEDEKEYYRGLAHDSQRRAKANKARDEEAARLERTPQPLTRVSGVNTWSSRELSDAGSMPNAPAMMLGAAVASRTASCDNLGEYEDGAPTSVEQAQRRPLATEVFEGMVNGMMGEVEDSFVKDINHLAFDHAYVQDVEYRDGMECGAICEAAPADLRGMAMLLRDHIDGVFGNITPTAQVRKDDRLFATEVCDAEGNILAVNFWVISTGLKAFSHNDQKVLLFQMMDYFGTCDHTRPDPRDRYSNVHLVPYRQPIWEPDGAADTDEVSHEGSDWRPRAPFDQGWVLPLRRLVQYRLDQWAEVVLLRGAPVLGGVLPDQVVVRFLEHRRSSHRRLDVYHLSGDSFPPFLVERAGAADALEARAAKNKRRAQPAGAPLWRMRRSAAQRHKPQPARPKDGRPKVKVPERPAPDPDEALLELGAIFGVDLIEADALNNLGNQDFPGGGGDGEGSSDEEAAALFGEDHEAVNWEDSFEALHDIWEPEVVQEKLEMRRGLGGYIYVRHGATTLGKVSYPATGVLSMKCEAHGMKRCCLVLGYRPEHQRLAEATALKWLAHHRLPIVNAHKELNLKAKRALADTVFAITSLTEWD